jgi:hypothetical protein
MARRVSIAALTIVLTLMLTVPGAWQLSERIPALLLWNGR